MQNKNMKILVVIGVVLVAAILVAGAKFSRFGVESPDYRIVEKAGSFEIREYPSMVIVSTPMENPDPKEGTSFMRLFRFISGANADNQKIAMTTPVITSQTNGVRKMSFIVPRKLAEKVPMAEDKRVEIETISGGRFAVYRFSGVWDVARFETAKIELARWLDERQLELTGEFLIANYDPPYTPSFLKRNEILVRLAES